MPAPVTLPRLRGATRRRRATRCSSTDSAPTARSCGATASPWPTPGWHAVAVDLRGHGAAPRALDYTLDAYAADLAITRPDGPRPLGPRRRATRSAARQRRSAAAEHFGWTRRLVLIDPAIHLSDHDREVVARVAGALVRRSRRQAAVRADASRTGTSTTSSSRRSRRSRRAAGPSSRPASQNAEWDVRDAAAHLLVPTHVIASDPKVYSIFKGELVDAGAPRIPAITVSVVTGAGHSPHRDEPERRRSRASHRSRRSSTLTRQDAASVTGRRARRPGRRRRSRRRSSGSRSASASAESSIGGTDPSFVVTSSVAVRPAPVDVVDPRALFVLQPVDRASAGSSPTSARARPRRSSWPRAAPR